VLELLTSPPLALTLQSFTDIEFWTSVGILAGIYTIFTLGLQLNVGFTGIFNFGQAAFMAVGAYSMAILVTESNLSFWLSLPIAIGITIAFGLLVGLPSLRLRTDYFAIATIAAAEAIRLFALNARELTGGAQGTFGFGDSWDSVSETIEGWLVDLGWTDVPTLFPLFLVVWAVAVLLMFVMSRVQDTPWGRVLRAIREDEDAARALGKNAFSYKLQSLSIAATLGAISGWFLVLYQSSVSQEAFEPIWTFIGYTVLVLGGLASFPGVLFGSVIFWTIYEGMRAMDLPLAADKDAALRFIVVGLILIGLMALRPQGVLGKKEEMVLGD
jgi:branched-chain amino acid transport system permease protein